MTNLFLISLVAILFPISLFSQKYKVELQSGYGSYSMEGLKDATSFVSENLPFKTSTVDNFPGYLYFRPSIGVKFGIWGLGVNYTFQSTGSRISAIDYSAEYRFDTKVKANCPALYAEVNIPAIKDTKYTFYTNLGILYSYLEMEEYFNYPNYSISSEQYSFKAKGYFFEPGVKFSYPISIVSLGVNLGYSFSFESDPYTLVNSTSDFEGESTILKNPKTGTNIYPEWDGLRVGLSISVSLGK